MKASREPRASAAFIVKQAHRSIVGGDDDIHPAVVIDVAERRPPAHVHYLHDGASLAAGIFEYA